MNVKRILLVLLLALCASPTLAALTLSQTPLFISSVNPRIMLLVSRDHQLSQKAFTDYTDLTGDAVVDSAYNDGIDYDGYFDYGRCYTYNTTTARFEPAAAVTSGTHQCGGTGWSGNFLNWSTMTRMDLLRKNLYGGYRSTDTVGTGYTTVLERQFLPVDAHAFVKVYTPPTTATAAMPSIQSLTGVTGQTSISLCNVTDTTSTVLTGKMATAPLPNTLPTGVIALPTPLIKLAAGAWPQWDASEVTECDVNSGSSTQPTALLATYNARVQVCVAAKLESNCKTYTHPTTAVQTLKPAGLLQKYGDVDADRPSNFGLITGSYAANKSGGMLRKNVLPLTNNTRNNVTSSAVCGDNSANDEIDACTGQFINQDITAAGIINTLNRMHIAGFKYSSEGANGSYQYSCNTPGLLTFSNGSCVDWGNPLAEMYLEALRYFAGASATTTFTNGSTGDSAILSSIPPVTWVDPLSSSEWCGLSNIVVLSTGLNSFDTDQLTSFTPTGGTTAVDAAALTATVGDASHENINGGSYLIGNVIGGTGVNANNQCTAKTLATLNLAKGVCPEVPSLEGGYAIAGLAYAPKTIDLRPGYADQRDARWGGASPINADWALRQPINTFALQLAEALPSFSPTVGTGKVTLLPACQANSSSTASAWTASTSSSWRNCSMTNLMVDTNVAQASVGSDHTAKTNTCSGNGTSAQCYSVSWEDSTWGNDHDMDGIQRLGYCVGTACSTFKMLCPTTSSAYATVGPWTGIAANQIVIATCVIQTSAGHTLTFGYTVSGTGTATDGPYYRILRPGNSNFYVGAVLPSGVTAPHNATFTYSSTPAGLLQNPLWYAAKYGGFTESTPTAGTPTPNLTAEWDANGDSKPDNYYLIRDPAQLNAALSAIFDAAAQPDASAASVATNSTNLQIQSRVFQARFSSADWNGQLLSYRIDTTGVLAAVAEWDGAVKLNAQGLPSSRVVITKGSTDGVPFLYNSLTVAQKGFLDKDATGTITDNCGTDRVDYVRGSATREGPNGTFTNGTCTTGRFRQRFASLGGQRVHFRLGDIVNANPWYVGAPQAGFSDTKYPGYSAFRTAKLSRTPVVYVGSNDGMLHGFDASLTIDGTNPQGIPTTTSGNEVLAYVPTAVYPNLSSLTAQNYNKNHRYFVDGSPMVADTDLGTAGSPDWRTVLVGALGSGGKGYYALDVSGPATFSEASAASILLWEFDETDMGYAFNLPPSNTVSKQAKQIVRVCTAVTVTAGVSSCSGSKWAAVLGNGYNSVNGKAALYVVFIQAGVDGTWSTGDFVKIVAEAPVSPATDANNGLSTPIPIDSDADGYADTVYAGDVKGNLWKFLIGPNASDASVTTSTATWKVAFSTVGCTTTCNPFFIAKDSSGNRQTIIAPPEVAFPLQGQLVFVGTGKYLEAADNTSTAVQTLYGIWDKHDGATTVAVSQTRAQDLLAQTVTSQQDLTGGTYRFVSTGVPNWRVAACTAPCTGTHLGWYLDLPTSGERNTGFPKIIGNLIFFNTFIPSAAPCNAGGAGWLMALDWRSGGSMSFPVFDTSLSGSIGAEDAIVGGFMIGAALGGTTLITGNTTNTGTNTGVGVSSLTSGRLVSTLINFGGSDVATCAGKTRCNWREIVQ